MSTTQQTLVIAEAGVNHNGDLQLAKKLVDAASDAGADVVKFQTFKSNQLVTDYAKQASYQKKALSRQMDNWPMLKRLEPSHRITLSCLNIARRKTLSFFRQLSICPVLICLHLLGLSVGRFLLVKLLTFRIYVR